MGHSWMQILSGLMGVKQTLKCLVGQSAPYQVLLPKSTVLEVIPHEMTSKSVWWRDYKCPVYSYAKIPTTHTFVAIIAQNQFSDTLGYYAIDVGKSPKIRDIHLGDLITLQHTPNALFLEYMVEFEGLPSLIPNLAQLEKFLMQDAMTLAPP